MKTQNLTAITERFEGLAADVLEEMVHEVEEKNHIKVKDLEVVLIPDQDASGAAPAVEVTLTLEPPAVPHI